MPDKYVTDLTSAVKTYTDRGDSAQEALIKSTVGWTGKNLLENKAATATVGEVTFTHNTDGSVTISSDGSAVETGREYIITARYNTTGNKVFIKNGEYIASGGVSQRISVTVYSTQDDAYAAYGTDEGQGLKFTVNGDSSSNDGAYVGYLIRVTQGEAVSPTTIYPMLRDARIKDSTFEPYHKTVDECKLEITYGTIDIGEGAPLADNMLYAVVEV